MLRSARSLCLLLLTATLLPVAASAQTGTIRGVVVDAENGEPLPGATVSVRLWTHPDDDSTRFDAGMATRVDGTFELTDIPIGSYRFRASSIGYLDSTIFSIDVSPDEPIELRIALEYDHYGVGMGEEIVVTASRRPEKATRAPASTSVVTRDDINRSNAVSTVDYVRDVGGLDIVQGGLSQNTVVARGFNNAFSGTLRTITDYRFAGLPSLRYNGYYFIPLVNEDIDQIEIVRGPGSALYGPNASNGVLHMISRSPFASQGTWLSVAAGERDLFHGMARHAGVVGEKVGYKISAQYMRGTDWGYDDPVEVEARANAIRRDSLDPDNPPDSLLVGRRDSAMERLGAEARLDWLISSDAKLTLTTGATLAINNTDATGIGAAQARNWEYWYHQMRFRWKDLFAQVFLNRSDAGDSYALRTGMPVVDKSRVFVAQVQHMTSLLEELPRFRSLEKPEPRLTLTYGADAIFTTPVTDSTVTGRNELDDDITELGVYLQSKYRPTDNLDLIAALRLDRHSRIDELIFSPRAAVVWSPFRSGSFRATFNRAYSAPTTNDLFLDVLAEQTDLFGIRLAGVPESGYTFRTDTDGSLLARSFFGESDERYYRLDQTHLLWQGLVEAAAQSDAVPAGFRSIIEALPAPDAGVIATELRVLDATTRAFEAFDGEVRDRPQTKPTINSTIEIGWQGPVLDRFLLRVDLYRSHYTNFVGPPETITPSVFYDPESLRSYLQSALSEDGSDSALVALVAGLITDELSGEVGNPDKLGVPIATISPEQAGDPTAVMLASRNYGEVTLYGYEIGLQTAITRDIYLGGNMSYVDKNFIRDLDGVADLSLNAPKFKYNLSAEWRGWNIPLDAGLSFRHVDGFPVRSGVFNGEVPGYSTLSLEAGWRPAFLTGLSLRLSISNLMTWVDGAETGPFETRHREFVGTPEIGRLGVVRVAYGF